MKPKFRKSVVLRVPKEQAAFLYQILESYDGVANFTTLDTPPSKGYRDISLFTTDGLREDFEEMLTGIHGEIQCRTLEVEPERLIEPS